MRTGRAPGPTHVLSLDSFRPPAWAVWQQQPAPIVVSLERRVLLQRLQPAEREAAPPRLRPAAQLGHVLARAVSQRDATHRRRFARNCRVARRRRVSCERERELLNPGGEELRGEPSLGGRQVRQCRHALRLRLAAAASAATAASAACSHDRHQPLAHRASELCAGGELLSEVVARRKS